MTRWGTGRNLANMDASHDANSMRQQMHCYLPPNKSLYIR
jgi:hypothetical protein